MRNFISLTVLIFLGIVSVEAYTQPNEYIRISDSDKLAIPGYHDYRIMSQLP